MLSFFVFVALTFAQTIPNCAVESNGVCTECDGNYFLLESGLCGSKEKFIGCSEFEDGGCKTCSSNYVKLSSTICMECKSLFAHCSDCDSTQCKECESGYSLKEVNTGIDGVKMICGSFLPFILMIVAILLDKHSTDKMGYKTVEEKKDGSGKFAWGQATDTTQVPAALDKNDPNYDSEEERKKAKK
ncbi:Uncharacterized protein QTN25_005480 [Entamoeba marina]